MGFGKKSSSNNNSTPQPTFTPQAQPAQSPTTINRSANTAEAQDRAATAQKTSLLATDTTSDEEMRRRQGAATLA